MPKIIIITELSPLIPNHGSASFNPKVKNPYINSPPFKTKNNIKPISLSKYKIPLMYCLYKICPSPITKNEALVFDEEAINFNLSSKSLS